MTLLNDDKLFNLLINDSKKHVKLYQPSSYWFKKNNSSVEEIKFKGLNNFRGDDNNIGASFSDNQNINILNDYYGNIRGLLKFFFEKIYPFKNIFKRQIHLTSSMKKELNIYKSKYLEDKRYILDLIGKFKFDNTVNCGCQDYIKYKNNLISTYYLNIADIHNNFIDIVNFKNFKSFFEIGGGFGANVHFLLSNYPNIRKVIYLDLPINLYVATQYLKKIYGDKVIDYTRLKEKKISFSNNDTLEIFCIPPWKIEHINEKIHLFQNTNSFLEMNEDIIKNYVKFIENILEYDSKIIISSYYNEKFNNILDPNLIPNFFKKKFERKMSKSIFPDKKNLFFISI